MTETIYAISSGRPPAAIAVMRISGPGAFAAVRALAGVLTEARRATLRSIRDPASGRLLDRALVVTFPGPSSATGEDIAELHLHGGRAVADAVERALAAQPGLRPAEAGEFTRRAVLAGRIDLTEAEGLADLLVAETETQRRAAIMNAEGAVARAIADWSARAVTLAAAIEAAIDHEDEEDSGDAEGLLADVRAGAAILAKEIDAITAQPGVERLRDGIRVVLAGPPNSGKSTLLNAMTQRDAAIVSPVAGTTRDRIEAPVTRNGLAWLLTDTAGLADDTADPIERVGVERARQAMATADIIVWLGDNAPPASNVPLIAVHARCDLAGRALAPPGRIAVSGHTPSGTIELWDALEVTSHDLIPSEDTATLNDRQRRLCCDAAQFLRASSHAPDILCAAEDLRRARLSLDRITGRAGVEDVFDALFDRFCIGK